MKPESNKVNEKVVLELLKSYIKGRLGVREARLDLMPIWFKYAVYFSAVIAF